MRSLPNELISHILSTHVSQIPIPRSRNSQPSREHRSVVRFSDRQRTILQAKAIETQTSDGADIANAGSCCASDQSDLFF